MPSGSLVIIDAGSLGAWSGAAEPTAADLPIDDDELLAYGWSAGRPRRPRGVRSPAVDLAL